jgi:hypothetical protein
MSKSTEQSDGGGQSAPTKMREKHDASEQVTITPGAVLSRQH